MSKSLSMAKEVASEYCSSASSSSSATTWNSSSNINGSHSAGCDDEQMQQLLMNQLVKQEQEGEEYYCYYQGDQEHQQDQSAGGLLLPPNSSSISYYDHHQHFNYGIDSYGEEEGSQLLFQECNGYYYYSDNNIIESSSSSSYNNIINIDGIITSFDHGNSIVTAGDAAGYDPVDAAFWNELGPLLLPSTNQPQSVLTWPAEEEAKPPADAVLPTTADHVSGNTANHLTKEVVAKYFHMPITQAARELNVGLTLLKKRCREIGVRRWPHRKLKSLQNLIANVKRLAEVEEEGGGSDEGRAKLEEAIRVLENERKVLDESPDLQLGPSTKRLRQACFKATYKRKRKMHLTSI